VKVGFAMETEDEVSTSGTEFEASSSARTTAAARSAVAAEAKRIVLIAYCGGSEDLNWVLQWKSGVSRTWRSRSNWCLYKSEEDTF
jgi:hypothetical protein